MQNQKRWRKGNISTDEDYDSDRIFEAFYDVLFKEEKENRRHLCEIKVTP